MKSTMLSCKYCLMFENYYEKFTDLSKGNIFKQSIKALT